MVLIFFRGGVVDSTSQSLFMLLMTMGPRDVSKVVTGPLSNYTVHFLRHLRDFFETVFKLETFVDKYDFLIYENFLEIIELQK